MFKVCRSTYRTYEFIIFSLCGFLIKFWFRGLASNQHYESPYHYSFHYLIQFVVWNISSSSTLLGQMESTCSLHIYDFHQFSSVLPSALSVKVSPNSDSFEYTFLYKRSVLSKISCPTIRRPRNKNSDFLIIWFIITEPKRRSH